MSNKVTSNEKSFSTFAALGFSAGLTMCLDVWDGNIGEHDFSQIKLLVIGAIPPLTLYVDKYLRKLHLESKQSKHELSFEDGSIKFIEELTATYRDESLPEQVREQAKTKLITAYELKHSHEEDKVRFHKEAANKAKADIENLEKAGNSELSAALSEQERNPRD